MKTRKHQVKIPSIDFGSPLAGIVVELERVREKYDHGTTDASLFFELKNLFQFFTSVISARIEGNHSTIVDVLDAINEASDTGAGTPDAVKEIENIQAGIDFIEKHVHTSPINKQFIFELHKIVVRDLVREGDDRPGGYRTVQVSIQESEHLPPAPADVAEHMDDLIDFINEDHSTQYDLVKDAIVHHRFVWIHPFKNGNGRVSRLLTYAMMAKQGFIDSSGIRTLNPTAVFGSNREEYYDHLSRADDLNDEHVLAWAEYMLTGVKGDLENLGKLQDRAFVRKHILLPALREAADDKRISEQQYEMLTIVANKDVVKANDFDPVVKGSHVIRAQAIKRLRNMRLLRTKSVGSRSYSLQLSPNVATRYIRKKLDENNLLPSALKDQDE